MLNIFYVTVSHLYVFFGKCLFRSLPITWLCCFLLARATSGGTWCLLLTVLRDNSHWEWGRPMQFHCLLFWCEIVWVLYAFCISTLCHYMIYKLFQLLDCLSQHCSLKKLSFQHCLLLTNCLKFSDYISVDSFMSLLSICWSICISYFNIIIFCFIKFWNIVSNWDAWCFLPWFFLGFLWLL